jgi:FlaG/FlaF family flagellin (archaellin)
MSDKLEALRAAMKTEVEVINSAEDLEDFERRHGMTQAGLDQSGDDVITVTGATIDGFRVTTTYSSRDPSGPYENLKDVHRVRVQVEGKLVGTGGWEE